LPWRKFGLCQSYEGKKTKNTGCGRSSPAGKAVLGAALKPYYQPFLDFDIALKIFSTVYIPVSAAGF